MAGIKGRSGGARPGAGRKPGRKAAEGGVAVELEPQAHGGALKRSNVVPPDPKDAVPPNEDSLAFLLSVQNSLNVDIKLRVRAAVAAAQYQHTKRGDGGKKDEQAEAAKKAAAGKFKRAAPPQLVVNNK